jgi:hypothetical protein
MSELTTYLYNKYYFYIDYYIYYEYKPCRSNAAQNLKGGNYEKRQDKSNREGTNRDYC